MLKSLAGVFSICLLFVVLGGGMAWAGEQIQPAEASLEAPKEASAGEEQVTYYSGNARVSIDSTGLAPKEIHVAPGTRVIWVNSRGEEVKVKFTSHAVSTTCEAPRGFVLGPKGIFQSRGIKSGGVASLCFLEPHDYDYMIEGPEPKPDTSQVATAAAFRGRVVVKK